MSVPKLVRLYQNQLYFSVWLHLKTNEIKSCSIIISTNIFFQIKFFNDPVVCTLQMLDTLEQKDPIHRAEVHCQLAQFLPDIPKVCTHHTLKKTEQIMYHLKDNM